MCFIQTSRQALTYSPYIFALFEIEIYKKCYKIETIYADVIVDSVMTLLEYDDSGFDVTISATVQPKKRLLTLVNNVCMVIDFTLSEGRK